MMRTARYGKRQQVGQAMAEGAAFMVVFSMVAVLVIILFINLGLYFFYAPKLNYVAAEAARYIDNNRYFLGMERQDYDPDQARAAAQAVADQLLTALGMPKTTRFDVNQTPFQLPGSPLPANATAVTLQCGLSVGFGGLIAPIPVVGSGVSTDAANIGPVPGQFALTGLSKNGQCVNIIVPCYGAQTATGGNMVVNQNTGHIEGVAGALPIPFGNSPQIGPINAKVAYGASLPGGCSIKICTQPARVRFLC